MRLLQKKLEDAYNSPKSFNYVGGILCLLNDRNQYWKFIQWYIKNVSHNSKETSDEELKRYFNWRIISVPQTDIEKNNIDSYNEHVEIFLHALEDDDMYYNPNSKEVAYRWLLRRNILEDNKQGENGIGRKFDFEIWSNRSLEHIYPKSLVEHKDENGDWYDGKNDFIPTDTKISFLKRDDIEYTDRNNFVHKATEHSIGNLVLLYKGNNSSFGNKDFEGKKNAFFTLDDDVAFKSRHLLHTVSVFAHSTWDGEQIARHKEEEIAQFKKQYGYE